MKLHFENGHLIIPTILCFPWKYTHKKFLSDVKSLSQGRHLDVPFQWISTWAKNRINGRATTKGIIYDRFPWRQKVPRTDLLPVLRQIYCRCWRSQLSFQNISENITRKLRPDCDMPRHEDVTFLFIFQKFRRWLTYATNNWEAQANNYGGGLYYQKYRQKTTAVIIVINYYFCCFVIDITIHHDYCHRPFNFLVGICCGLEE